MFTPIRALLAGKTQPFARGELSAISKQAFAGQVCIKFLGLMGDEQADPKFHGGPEKAVHHYPYDHYSHWQGSVPNHPLLAAPGAFGENISTIGWTEANVCIGDRIRCGTALLEISQGRQPCWKQGHRMNWAALPGLMVREHRSGWYYRVIEEGTAAAGEGLTLIDRSLPEWTVKRVFGLLIGGDYKADPGALKALAGMDQLFGGWRQRAVDLMGAR
jgi:MOSC domain-containing protein YiiM